MTRFSAFLATVLAGATLACSNDPTQVSNSGSATVPAVNIAGMEPQVAAKIEASRKELSERPESASSWGRFGMICHAHSLFEPAVASYARAFELAPGDYRWPYLSALARQKGRLDQALEHYRRAAALTPDNPAFFINYAAALELFGRAGEAELRYREALSRKPDSSHALYGLGNRAFASGDLEKSVELLQEAAGIAPNHGEVHALLARIHQRRGDDTAARREALLARAYPDPSRAPDPVVQEMESLAVNSRAVTKRGLRLVAAGRFAEAEAAFRTVLEIRPGSARDYANLGGTLARQSKLDAAITNYRKALEIAPSDPYAHNNLALALAERGDLAGAEQHLETALAADPAYAEGYLNRGSIGARRGDVDQAQADFERAIQLAPGLSDAYNQLGALFARRGQLREAMTTWESGRVIDPRDLSALYNLAVGNISLGRHADAVEKLREALSHAPNSSRLARLLAWELATAPDSHLRSGSEALDLAHRVHRAYPAEPEAADTLAAALAEVGRFDEAVHAAERALAGSRQTGRSDLAVAIGARLSAYRSGRPYRQPQALEQR